MSGRVVVLIIMGNGKDTMVNDLNILFIFESCNRIILQAIIL